MAQKYIIVIGAGVSGLVCANLIAKECPDYKITVVESQDKPGGLAQAWEHDVKLTDGRKVRATYELTHAVSDLHKNGTLYQLFADFGFN